MEVALDKKLIKHVARCLGTKQCNVEPQALLMVLARGKSWKVRYLFKKINKNFGKNIPKEQRKAIKDVCQLAIAADSAEQTVIM